MLFIYNEDCVECIRLDIDIEEQRKHSFSRYVLNFVFFNIQTLKKSFDRHRTFVNVESLHDHSYSSSFQFFLNESVSKCNSKKL